MGITSLPPRKSKETARDSSFSIGVTFVPAALPFESAAHAEHNDVRMHKDNRSAMILM
jgi:hypothetical protein